LSKGRRLLEASELQTKIALNVAASARMAAASSTSTSNSAANAMAYRNKVAVKSDILVRSLRGSWIVSDAFGVEDDPFSIVNTDNFDVNVSEFRSRSDSQDSKNP
jgi:hypothetical protein